MNIQIIQLKDGLQVDLIAKMNVPAKAESKSKTGWFVEVCHKYIFSLYINPVDLLNLLNFFVI